METISYLNSNMFYFICEVFDEANNVIESYVRHYLHKDYLFNDALTAANTEATKKFGKQEVKIINNNIMWFNWKVRPITGVEYSKHL